VAKRHAESEPTLLEDVALLTPGFDIGALIAFVAIQLEVQAQLVVNEVAGRDGDLGIGQGQVHADIVSQNVVLHGIHESIGTAGTGFADWRGLLAIGAHLQVGNLYRTYKDC